MSVIHQDTSGLKTMQKEALLPQRGFLSWSIKGTWPSLSPCLQLIFLCDGFTSPDPLSGTKCMRQRFSNLQSGGGKHLANCQNPLSGYPKMETPSSFPVTGVRRLGVGFWNRYFCEDSTATWQGNCGGAQRRHFQSRDELSAPWLR